MSMGGAANLDAVSKNSIWTEHVKKENKTLKLAETFSIIDPHSMVVLTEKPNRTVPSKGASKEAVAAAAEMLHELSYLKNTDLTPTERLALPITGNMEYGFFTVAPPKPNPMFDYKTRTCDVTQYATQFSMSTGASPFARDGAVSGK